MNHFIDLEEFEDRITQLPLHKIVEEQDDEDSGDAGMLDVPEWFPRIERSGGVLQISV